MEPNSTTIDEPPPPPAPLLRNVTVDTDGILTYNIVGEMVFIAERTGFFDVPKMQPLLPAVLNYMQSRIDDPASVWSTQTLEMAIKESGGVLSAQEKRGRGLATRSAIGLHLADALTIKGKTDPRLAAKALAHGIQKQFSRGQMTQTIKNERCYARILIRHDGKTCVAGLQYRQVNMHPDHMPDFPLPECNMPVCRCGYDRHPTLFLGEENESGTGDNMGIWILGFIASVILVLVIAS